MTDNIPSSAIHNRRLILELRFEPNPQFMDKRGLLLTDLEKTEVIKNVHWEAGDAYAAISDNSDALKVTRKCHIDYTRFSYEIIAGDTVDTFYNSFSKLYAAFAKNMPSKVKRIGCRIQGTYATKSQDYKIIFTKFLGLFPDQFLFTEYSPNDFNFQLVYPNGRYVIGPISEKDAWTQQQFANNDVRVDKVGFAIDTDNYVARPNPAEPLKEGNIRDVFVASLAVEKQLFDRFNSL